MQTQKRDREMESSCVECGKEANKGSLKHPYCKICYAKIWQNNNKKYIEWLSKYHNQRLISPKAFMREAKKNLRKRRDGYED